MVYNCNECGSNFPKLSQLLQHRRTENHWRMFSCDTCGKTFNRKVNLDRHKKKHTITNNLHCTVCSQPFTRYDNLKRHQMEKHQMGGGLKKSAENDDIPIKRLKKNDDPKEFYNITKINEQRMEKFKTTSSTYKVTFKDLEVTYDVSATLERLFNAIFEDLTRGAKPEDLIRLVIQSPTLDYPIVIPFLRIPELTTERFMGEVERVLQSNEDFTIDEGLMFDVIHVNMPNGGSRKKCHYVNLEKTLKEKRCFIRIQNDDDLCCARALITAKAKLDQHEKWNSIRQGREIQKQLAERLHKNAGVFLGPCGIDEIKKFQKALCGYQINIVSADHFNGIIYAGPDAEKKIYLYYSNNHYDIITSMPAFLSRNYYCTICGKGYDHKEKHSCNNACHNCKKIHSPSEEKWIHCEICNRLFRGQECFDLHQKATAKGNSTCLTYIRCEDCGKTINKNMSEKPHICGSKYCELCKDFFEEGHQCYMQPEDLNQDEQLTINDDEKNVDTYIFFDLECRQQDIVQCEKGYESGVDGKCIHCKRSKCGAFEHVPNLCVVHKVCTVCMDRELGEKSECELCGKNELIFSGLNTIDTFCSWLFSEENVDATVICHNFQGYDSYPILQYLYKNAIVPTVIPNGAKIMSLIVPSCKIKMIDSINFLPMALSKLPAMFGFSELSKGYFPHLFNRQENQTTVLNHLPNMKYYNPDGMKPDSRRVFMEWYEANIHTPFDFQKEILKYCRSDVDILRRCCLKFRADFLKVTQVDPFKKNITIASACQTVFRTNFLKENTIGIIPTHGYNPEQVQSIKALQWVKYQSYALGIRIQHARNGGERVIGPYRVDGYYETGDQKVVLEFHGDFWHGNPKLYSSSTVNPVNKLTMGSYIKIL
ncbi:uncharacterized protein LOC123565260 [Mercenaria mercenaria]|uniref:uncharacterized protein LOC123565260 n=1 Tax=Mercenaria mercenaria TaxID=6596 RepID=UPI00234EA494|nr:uncharacterized protein LOC123565260 [Mercenaria mercenaria]